MAEQPDQNKRILTIIDNGSFEEDTRKLGDGRRLPLTEEECNDIGIDVGEKVQIFTLELASKKKVLLICKPRKWTAKAVWEEILGALAIIALVGMLLPTNAFAQEVVDQQPTAPVTITDLERFRGPNAYIPFVMEMRFPAGIEHIQEVRSISGSSAYTMFDEVNTQPGIVAKRFTTASLDTFTITIGQKYSTPMDQVAEFVIRSGDNSEITWSRTLAIKGLEFQQTFEITTMPVPHIPTAEELNAGVYTRIDQLDNKVSGIANNLHNLNDGLGNTSLTLQGATGIQLVLASVSAIAIVALIWHALTTRPKQRIEEQMVKHTVMKPDDPQDEERAFLGKGRK